MTFLTKIQAILEAQIDDILERYTTQKDVFVIFTKTKEMKKNFKDFENYTGPDGFIAYEVASLSKEKTRQLARKFKYAHVIKNHTTKVINLPALNDSKIDLIIKNINRGLTSVGYHPKALNAAQYRSLFKGRGVSIPDVETLFLNILKYGFPYTEDPRKGDEQVRDLYLGNYRVLFLKDYTIFIDASDFRILETVQTQTKIYTMDAEDEQLLKFYSPTFEKKSIFYRDMTLEEIKKNLSKMTDDDLAWQLMHNKDASSIADLTDFGTRETLILQLLNKNISKTYRTSIASWMLDKAGVSFARGVDLEKFLELLAKKNLVGRSVMAEINDDKVQNQIRELKDPREIQKLASKKGMLDKYDHYFLQNPNTPVDVLQKIYEQDNEPTWTGFNPNRYGFPKVMQHSNFPIESLVKYYDFYLKKYPQPGALGLMEGVLWARKDLPETYMNMLINEHGYTLPPPASLPKDQFNAYWKKVSKKDLENYTTPLGTAENPSVSKEALKDILNAENSPYNTQAKQVAFEKLKERGDLSEKEVINKVKTELKFEGDDDLLVRFGLRAWLGTKGTEKLKFTKVSPKEKEDLQRELQAGSTHDEFTFEVVDAYNIDRPIHKDYQVIAGKLGNVKHNLYHGTSLSNAAGILATGINTAAFSRTGQMFGAGFYLAESSSKAAQYASDNFSHAGFGVIFKMDAVLGKTADWKYGRPESDYFYKIKDPKIREKLMKLSEKTGIDASDLPAWHLRYDSVTAHKGMALRHDEVVIKNGNQINITKVILIRKRLKEK